MSSDLFECEQYCSLYEARIGACRQYLKEDYDYNVEIQLESPMPWIGMYIAAASVACSLAMAADAFTGFRSSKFWFPCKYFSLNAFSLTALAVTMKLPLDLTTMTLQYSDKLACISSPALISTAMSNFITSLGSMENNEIMLNIAALGILVITISGNVIIHMGKTYTFGEFDSMAEDVGSVILMLILLVTLCCLALMVPSAERYMALKYNEFHHTISSKQVEWGKFAIDELAMMVKMYWVMAATGSPQFVMARSAISATSGLMCVLAALTAVEAHLRLHFVYGYNGQLGDDISNDTSNYKWSISWILYIQIIGVGLGSIAPLSRWFLASWFKISETCPKSFRDEFKIEKYWTSRLVHWRNRSLPLQIQHLKLRKLLHNAKILLLNICICVQIFLVSVGKLVLLTSATFVNAVFLCFGLKKDDKRYESRGETELDFSRYVLLLEGEAKLPDKILSNICKEVDKLMQIGENKQPKNLITLLKKSASFNGLGQFDSNEVPSLHSQEPPNCWSLPVVTLTSISIALTNIEAAKTSKLMAGVSEGLSLVNLIDKTLDKNGELESIRKAADVVWVGVELYRKWVDRDLLSTNVRGTTPIETLQNLANAAEKIVKDFTSQTEDILMQNPLNWPVKVIAANSMYRITQTILLQIKQDRLQSSDDEVFESLSTIISNILAACLTNLVHVVTLKCHRDDIKERQESVGRAAILVGESKGILEILQQHQLPSLDGEKAANIDEWRASMAHDIENPSPSVSAIPQPNAEHASGEIEG